MTNTQDQYYNFCEKQLNWRSTNLFKAVTVIQAFVRISAVRTHIKRAATFPLVENGLTAYLFLLRYSKSEPDSLRDPELISSVSKDFETQTYNDMVKFVLDGRIVEKYVCIHLKICSLHVENCLSLLRWRSA